MTQAKTPPYNTGKVKIGLAYEPPMRRVQSIDEARIQDALIGSFDNKQERELKRYLGVVLFAFLTALVVAYASR